MLRVLCQGVIQHHSPVMASPSPVLAGEAQPVHLRPSKLVQTPTVRDGTTEIFHGEVFIPGEAVKRCKPSCTEMQGNFPRDMNECIPLQLNAMLLCDVWRERETMPKECMKLGCRPIVR